MMSLDTLFALQRGRIQSVTSLERDIQKLRWVNAPKRLTGEQERPAEEYPVHHPRKYDAIMEGYLALKLLYA